MYFGLQEISREPGSDGAPAAFAGRGRRLGQGRGENLFSGVGACRLNLQRIPHWESPEKS
jgi:hypothetical protein